MSSLKNKTVQENMPAIATLDSMLKAGVKGKRVLLRADLNVPIEHGKVADTTRIDRVVPTIHALAKAGAKVVLLSHFGRPEGKFNPDMSLAPIVDTVSACVGKEVKFAVDCIGRAAEEAVSGMQNGDVLLLENLRFYPGETKNDKDFADRLAALGDVFVNDAFSCSHRAHASIVGLAERLPAVAGLLLEEEVNTLEATLGNAKRPMAALVGGAKISTKVALLESLVNKVDMLIIGGGMANTFLAAEGLKVGISLCEQDSIDTAKRIMAQARKRGCEVVLPQDVVVATSLTQGVACTVVDVDAVPGDTMILDIGPLTVVAISKALQGCKTVVWNGPLGAFETRPFDVGTISVARTLSSLTQAGEMVSVAGGGDVLSALSKSGLRANFTYISTAGGAFLEWLEGKELPGVERLRV